MSTMTRTAEMTKTKTAEQTLVVCPRCAGNKRVMDFSFGNRTTGEPAGWKAIECPGCSGAGSVDASAATDILAKMTKDGPT
jgi:hypothetical protein